MIPTLRKFRGGGQSKQIWGASLETFSGEAQFKKSPYILFMEKFTHWQKFYTPAGSDGSD